VISNFFPDSQPEGPRALFRVHRKRGAVFGLTPVSGSTNWERLLPAQSVAARGYRWAARLASLVGLPFPRETVNIAFEPSNPLLALAKTPPRLPLDALILPGNPQGLAPRLVILCADEKGRPSLAIKAGHSAVARDLIRRERAILYGLQSATGARLAPRLLGEVETSSLSAFATEFVDGPSPSSFDSSISLRKFLTQEIDSTRTITIAESPLWAQLSHPSRSASSEPSQLFSFSAFQHFSSTSIHPCIFHGDFAPWNIREAKDGTWTAIDWERGDFDGIPGWDWLHFVLQPAVLVKKWEAPRVLELGRQTISSPNFLVYLDAAVPGGPVPKFAEFLLRSYLLYNWLVLQPTERRDVHQALAEWAGGEPDVKC
jgi:hypothetical protein